MSASVSHVSTGSVGVDGLLGGGWKRGTIGEIWGGTGTGKTTLAQHAVNDLEPIHNALWITIGSEVPHRPVRSLIASPRSAEMVFTLAGTAVTQRAALVVVDSANGLIREREIEGSPAYDPWYRHSAHREYRVELTALSDACADYGGVVLFLSKPRDKERLPIRGTGVSEVASQRVTLKALHKAQDGTTLIEASVKSGASCEYVIRPGSGIDWADELLRIGVDHGIVSKRGAWYVMPDNQMIQGRDDAIRYVRQYPAIAAYLNREIRKDFEIE